MKLRIIVSLIIAVLLAGFWSCGPAENQVTVDVAANNEFPTRGDSVTMTLTVSSELENLTKVIVEVSSVDTNGAEITYLEETRDVGDLSFTGDYTFVVSDATAFNESVNVVVTSTDDIDGTFETINTDITVVSYMKIFRSEAQIGHQWGPINGGFNLVEGIEAYRDAPNGTKDIVDQSAQQKELSKSFSSHAEAGSEFIDLGSEFNVSELHAVRVAELFDERSVNPTVTVAEGTYILARLRGGVDYALIKFITIDPDFGGNTDNKGLYTFDLYKLQ